MSSVIPSELLPFPAADSLALLAQVRQRLTRCDLAKRFNVTPKTISRWENRQTECPVYVQAALRDLLRSGVRSEPGTEEFTFIDLFAGIGGMRLGFEKAGTAASLRVEPLDASDLRPRTFHFFYRV